MVKLIFESVFPYGEKHHDHLLRNITSASAVPFIREWLFMNETFSFLNILDRQAKRLNEQSCIIFLQVRLKNLSRQEIYLLEWLSRPCSRFNILPEQTFFLKGEKKKMIFYAVNDQFLSIFFWLEGCMDEMNESRIMSCSTSVRSGSNMVLGAVESMQHPLELNEPMSVSRFSISNFLLHKWN